MARRFEWTWSRRALSVVVAAALVWGLLLVVEHHGGAEAQTRRVSPVSQIGAQGSNKSSAGAQTQAATAAATQQAALAASAQPTVSAAITQAEQATQLLAQQGLPPAALSRVCASLLGARAILVALGPAGRPGLAVIDRLIARFGCLNISSVPPPPPRCTRPPAALRQAANPVVFIRIDIDSPPATGSRIVAGCGIVNGPNVTPSSRAFLTCTAASVAGGVQLTYSIFGITDPLIFNQPTKVLECNVTTLDALGNNQVYIFIFTVSS